jgi:mannose-6-phosphate isomerase-like protein (cupin superfamily)
MKVGEDMKEVKERDAIWIPAGSPHALENHTTEETEILVIAAYPRS